MTAPPSPLLRDPDFPTLMRYILSATGLEYYGNRDNDLAGRVQRRLTARNLTTIAPYLALLRRADTNDEARAERDALIDAVTIGETYFFRFPEQFDALRQRVLPDLIRRNGEHRRLDIWCAGSSSGAEPYTLSIILRRDFGDLLRDWNTHILATDINQRLLSQARAGWYHSWALRTLDTEERRALFDDEPTTGRYLLKAGYKRNVTFATCNLVHDAPPLPDGKRWDLIFCRNVLIYFDVPTIERLIERFAESLEPGGYLFLGHAEPGPVTGMSRLFEILHLPGAVIYRRRGADSTDAQERVPYMGMPLPPPPSAPPLAVPSWTPPVLPEFFGTPPLPPSTPVSAAPVAIPPPTTASGSEVRTTIRQLLDSDRLTEVLARLAPLLAVTGTGGPLRHDPVLHYYQALALEGEERWEEAETALRRALYLDRSFLLAHYHQALLAERRGDTPGAARALDTAQKLLQTASAHPERLRLLAEVGDLTPTEMEEIVRLKRAALR